jgi:pimeloyl-ACP methyl ester carboxylesterase
MSAPVMLRHGRINLALHELATGDTSLPRLLLLHGLGESTPTVVPVGIKDSWRGPIWGLDFCGHGQSDIAPGGGYSCEILMADVDTALRHLGPCLVLGSGLGGYVALLTAGAAPERVLGVIVQGGPGLAGGGVRPGSETILVPASIGSGGTPDPWALMELAIDVRPPNYVTSFVRQYVGVASSETPVSICTAARPAWLASVVEEYGVVEASLSEALDGFMGTVATKQR